MDNSNAKILDAAGFAAEKHEGQFRKNAAGKKVPYIVHPLRVAASLARAGAHEDVIVAAILHDTLEDTDTTRAELIDRFGRWVADTVLEVTDDKMLSKDENRNRQVAKAPYMSDGAKLIKVADKADNVMSIVESPPRWSDEKKLLYVESATRVVIALGLGFEHAELVGRFWSAVSVTRASIAAAA
jgi:guanosine-3',5'-bis(diphosphate) 3'-pyrophosphohydrolase